MIINVWIVAAAGVGFKGCWAGLHCMQCNMMQGRDIKMNTHLPNNMDRFIQPGCVSY